MTFTSTETLETIYAQINIPLVLRTILKQNTLQVRSETSFLASIRAKSTFADWGAALSTLNPTAVLEDGKRVPLFELLEKKAGSLNDLKEVQFDVKETDLLAYEKVSNTPSDQPIISVTVFIKFSGDKIDQFRIAATGVSRSAYTCVDLSKDTAGKTLDESIVKAISERFKKEITPIDTYMGSAEYRKEMAGVLIERILSKKINGEM